MPGLEHSQRTCSTSEAYQSPNLVYEWVSSRANAAQILFPRHDFVSYRLYSLLFCWTPAERGAHISRCPASQAERDKREVGAPLLLGESPVCSPRHFSSMFVNSWYNCNRVRASLQRRDVLGRHGCTMQPPASHRHKCKKIQVNSSGLLICATTSSAESYVF